VNPKLDPLINEYCLTKNDALKGLIVKKHQSLIEYIARKLAFNKHDIDDLIQVGSIALLKALDRFDPEKNTEFPTFATPNIIGEIKHYFRDKSRVVKVPRKLQELYSKIKQEITKQQQLGNSVSIPYLSNLFEVSDEAIIEAMEAGQNVRVISLDAPSYKAAGNNGSTLVDQIGTDNNEHSLLNKETLKQAIKKLSARQRRIVYLRFYGGLSQTEIAERLHISQMHVSRLLSKSIHHLKKEITC